MAKAKRKKGDHIEVDGKEMVIVGFADFDTHEGQFETVSRQVRRPQPGAKKDVFDTVEDQVPVLERTPGYLVQDPTLPWSRVNCTWVRAKAH